MVVPNVLFAVLGWLVRTYPLGVAAGLLVAGFVLSNAILGT